MTARGWAVVTGASSGIGREIACVLAEQGHDLVLVARRGPVLEALAEDLRQRCGVQAHTVALDLGDRDAPRRLAQQLQADDIVPAVLVNNAGFGLYGAHAKQDPEQVRALLELNIVALTLLTRQLLPPMLQAGRGRILNIASTAAFLPGPRMATYFASKAYVLSYSEALAEELAGRGISVTALCPGPTRSEFFERAGMSPAVLAMGRMPSSREVAEFGVRAMQRGQRVAIHGASNHLLAFLPRLAPRRAVAWVVGWITRPRGRRAG